MLKCHILTINTNVIILYINFDKQRIIKIVELSFSLKALVYDLKMKQEKGSLELSSVDD